MQICTVYAFISAIELPRIPAYLPKKLVLLYYSALLYTRKNITVLTLENTKKEIAPKQRKILYPHEKKIPAV